jgi:hypothetical protein
MCVCLWKPKAIKPDHMVFCLAMGQERKISPSLPKSFNSSQATDPYGGVYPSRSDHNEPYSWTSTESSSVRIGCPYLIIQSIINHIA